jgi:hypothetical protein
VTSYNLDVNGYVQKSLGIALRKMIHTLGLFWLLLNRLPSPQTPNVSAEKPG